jgi:hypothetical protein
MLRSKQRLGNHYSRNKLHLQNLRHLRSRLTMTKKKKMRRHDQEDVSYNEVDL